MPYVPARILTSAGLAGLLLCAGVLGQDDAPPRVEATELANQLYLLSGGGGANSTALVGEDGVLLVDSKLDEPSAEAMLTALEEMDSGQVRFLVNTHVHPDHTGGNLVLGEEGALIIGHEGVRSVLAAGQRGGPPAPDQALPTLTFGDQGGLTLHLNGETVRVMPMPAAHTTDNSLVHFENANVYHLGDIYSPARYPVIAGGTLQGYIDGVDRVLAMADAQASFIPGSGGVGDREDLEAYRDMLATVLERVSSQVEQGRSLEEIQASEPTAEFDSTWGSPDHPLFLPVVYRQLTDEG